MNSNLKLLPAALLMAVLALAGCGGSSSDEMPPPPPPPTPEEECLAGDGVVYEDGVCKTAEDLRNEGRDAEAERRQAEADAAAAEQARKDRHAAATKLFGQLGGTTGDHLTAATGVGGDRYGAAQIAMAVKGKFGSYNTSEFSDENADGQVIHVFQYDNKMDDDMQPLTEDVAAADFAATSIKSTVFSSNEPKEHEATGGVFKARGTYNGAAGEYRCTVTAGQTCVSRAAAGGGIQLAGGGTWVFDPDAGAMQLMPDADYATFGWWLDEAVATAGERKVRTFSIVTGDAATGVDGVTGTATYRGLAVGKASVYSPSPEGDNVAGAFTADAELTAAFGATPTLEGSITGFNVGGETPDWSVSLNSSTLAAGGTVEATANTTWTIDGVKGAAGGVWSAQMYDKGADVGGVARQPDGVTGGFRSAHGTNALMSGAFAAEQ